MVVGTVGSNVVPVMQKICTENNTFLIIPTAASNDTTRAQCHPLVFRVSHSNWQITAPAGSWLFKHGKKRVMTMGMNYAAGKEEVGAFADEFKKAGGGVHRSEMARPEGARLPSVFRRCAGEAARRDVHLLCRLQRG